VATARGFSNSYLRAIEEVTAPDGRQGGPDNPAVRGDMVFFETPHDGAVFAVGSITWMGSLSHNGYDNPVSRITGNVLRAFASGRWPER
jgi:N,N-dimethylformamidase